ncbi:alpha-L-rhamnosidase N-terminal domain-containing protein [Cohnella ginsengisoli]|uniref:Alpha-L-rhamnosidase N-terminal domain-containing protein n=1 Tax=Cohnella ginsengisoli TaxID=425004 RepID=A0A9X4KMK0_9BACL|nr:alpha-L-rhamnosidase C-terminal domain-containing protein [Cohnella ginsengisoli]MDG0794169.1 alpha-L-rhamnosidase N-terminal domain-containing protein [Cohnella ginsengisoli]
MLQSEALLAHDTRDWRGQWIWTEGPVREIRPGRHTMALFRRTFQAARGERLTVLVSANSRYRLFLNGVSVSIGPCKGDANRRFYETVELGGLLRDGTNVLAAQVVHYAGTEPWTMGVSGPISIWSEWNGGFLLDGALTDAGGRIREELHTGDSWRCFAAEGYANEPSELIQWLGGLERVDGSKLPHGWTQPEFDEAGWPQAVPFAPLRNPYGERVGWALQPRPIPPLYERETAFAGIVRAEGCAIEPLDAMRGPERAPVIVPAAAKIRFELDAGLLTTGYLHAAFSGGAGAEIRLICAECYEPYASDIGEGRIKGVRNMAEGGKLVGDPDVYLAAGTGTPECPEVYEPFWFRTFRYVQVEIAAGNAPIALHGIGYRETGYPLEPTGAFDCSDDELNQIWRMSLNTLRRCMHETYEDCPYYEQLQYTMDTRLQMLYTYHLTTDDRLARRAIEDFHSSQLPSGMLQCRFPSMLAQVIPGFSLYWIDMLDEHYRYFGDIAHVNRYRASMLKLLDWFERYRTPEGIVGMLPYELWTHFDWVESWPFGAPPTQDEGPMTLHSLMYAAGLRKAAGLLDAGGWRDAAGELRARAQSVIEAVNRLCWSAERQLYANCPGTGDFSVHAQIRAVLSGAVNSDAAAELLRRTFADDTLPVASLPQTFASMRALESCGLHELAFKEWDRWRLFLGLELTTLPEMAHGTPRSDCHAWSALPLYEFSATVLGVRPGAPGFARIRIAPRPEGLAWASGTTPTPNGPVKTAWRRDGDVFTLSVDAPPGIPVDIVLPDGTTREAQGGETIRAACRLQLRQA